MTISNKELEYFLNLTEDNITKSFIMENFGKIDGKFKYKKDAPITIPKGAYGDGKVTNLDKIDTTLSILVANTLLFKKDLLGVIGYINEPFNGKLLGKLNKKLSYLLIEKDITLEQQKAFHKKTQWFMRFVSVFSPNHTMKLLTSSKQLRKKRDKLLEENKEALEKGDEIVADKITKELLEYAKEYLKDDPSLEMYDSGARASFENNFKNQYVLKGLVPDRHGNLKLIKSNHFDGISKDEYAVMANSLVASSYSKSVNTAEGGYQNKLYLMGFQSVVLGEKGSDCGTKGLLGVYMHDGNIEEYFYNYGKVNGTGSLELITLKNKDKFLNKTNKVRTPSFCKQEDICNKCMGELDYELGIKNIGLSLSVITNTIMVKSMKLFHDSTMDFIDMEDKNPFNI